MKTNKLTFMALLTALALIIFTLESFIPVPLPIPGIKLGLANIITLYAVWTLRPQEALCILLVRIVLGSIFTGQLTAFCYSLAGGLCCFFLTVLLQKLLNAHQIWISSIAGAIAHNIGQITTAILLTATPELIAYLPVLLFSSMITGAFTGFAAQQLYFRLQQIQPVYL